jgi:transcriptional regulator with XRE-family HTH domain
MKPNTEWFKSRFDKLGMSGRHVAHKLNVDPAIITRLISGKNNWTVEYALDMAKLLGVSLREMLVEGVGVDAKKYAAVFSESGDSRGAWGTSPAVTCDAPSVHESEAHYGFAPVVGVIDDAGDANDTADAANVPLVEAPLSKKFDVFRLHSLGPYDGTLFFVGEAQPPESCVNRLCLVRGRSRSSLRIVRKGSAGATFDLVNPRNPLDREVNASLEVARPVTWLRCPV